ncbi:uncharacterized protein LOC123292319 [Chrysoperla carnea]|uniref:uncharacterized protein LOC123292319 n=1 Tax=Chrysoperla carnea TaxID=189513 RepID=UPI001D087E8C|nr:uncharacterized protein LOC123292319 [Chrysoperla carnea]
MASNNGPIYQQSQQQQQQQQRTTQYHCKECGVYFDSAQSLDVHLQYHKENLLTKWANQAANQQQSGGEEANNNKIKRELITSSVAQAAADSSDNTIVSSNNKNPPDSPSGAGGAGNSGHPATPQSYHSAPSPYQNEPTNFSPNFHQFHIKTEGGGAGGPNDGLTPPTMLASPFHPHYQNLQQYPPPPPDQTQYFDQLYAQDYLNNKAPTNNYHRYQPYQNPNAQVTSSSNNHSPVGGIGSTGPYGGVGTTNSQPTPSPSPKQCDKCGFVCETAGQLIEHLQIAHPNTPFPNQFQFPPTNGGPKVKKEDGEPQAEILDLDSQKVHVYQTPEEQEQDALKRQQQAELAAMAGAGGGHHNPHSVSAMLSTWPPPSHHQKMMFHPHPHTTYDETSKMYNGMGGGNEEHKMFDQQPKLFQPHQITNNDYHHQNVSTTTHHDNILGGGAGGGGGPGPGPGGPGYRPYEHIPVQPSPPIISSTQIVSNQQSNLPTPITTKGGANWKSNEARRPKTYNCSACNKWFTSSGHLKRHYNTTLHKNAVKSSGQPDPATLPISAHHHPTRDPNHHSNRQKQQQQQQQQQHDVNSQSPGGATMMGGGGHLGPPSQPPTTTSGGGSGDDTNSDDIGSGAYDSRGQHPGLLQQPPSGPYDRHPPNISQNSLSPNLTNLSSGSPPNGEAGPSAINELSRGLQLQQSSTTSTPITHNIPHQLSHLSPQHHHSTNIHPQISPTTTTHHPHQLLPPFNIINQPMMDIMPTSGGHQVMGTSSSTPHHSPSIFHHPGHQITNYPNELSPHVTHPTMVVINSNTLPQQQLPVSTTTSHNSIGEYQQQDFTNMICNTNATSSSQENNCGPLPSFAQFAMLSGVQPLNQLGVQIINSNVGGPSSVTDSSSQTSSYHISTTNDNTNEHNNDHEESEFILPDLIDENTKISSTDQTPPNNNNYQHIIYRSSPIDHHFYQQNQQITVLQPIDQNTYNFGDKFSDKLLILSPNNNNYNQNFIDYNQHQTMINDKDLSSSSLSPLSPPNLSIKREEIENETSSPLITSTGSPLNIKRMESKRGSGGGAALNGAAGSGVHKCIDCDKIFNKACYLTQHNKTFHSGDKPFKCGRCGKRFSDNTNYNIHLKKHAGDKPHKCEQCPKQFNHKTDLRRHMCLHSGYKPYACDTCGKGFIRKDHMVKHCDTHTRKTSKLQQQQQLQTQQQQSQIQSQSQQTQDDRKFDTTAQTQSHINSNNGGNTGNF